MLTTQQPIANGTIPRSHFQGWTWRATRSFGLDGARLPGKAALLQIFCVLAIASVTLVTVPLYAQNAVNGSTPEASPSSATGADESYSNEPFDFMSLLTEHGLHDIKNESWNVYGQFTWISNWKASFSARYTNTNGSINSLVTEGEHSYTGTLTAFMGLRLWSGAEAYYVPEGISEKPLSELRGLSAIQNFELQKGGTPTPQIYRSRSYLRQTIGLGGGRIEKKSGPMQLGTTEDSRRLVLTVGSFSILDFLDKNSFWV